MKISACWIAKDEEGNIARSIKSVQGAADELIVVDTGSTDRTAEVAESLGARVEHFEWTGDFSAARNYAMSMATGDVMLFLDADEWFSEPLTPRDREKLELVFKQNPGTEVLQIPIRNLSDEGAVKTISSGVRIMKLDAGLSYHKRVHETLTRKNGDTPNTSSCDIWTLNHSGYGDSILEKKMRRNIALLEEVAKSADNPEERHLQHCYLVREYFHLRKIDNSLRNLLAVLKEPELIRHQYYLYRHGFAPLTYTMMLVGMEKRQSVSRREIYRKLVEPFKQYLNDYPGVHTIDLFYSSIFDLREDELLAQIGPALAAAEKAPSTQVTYYREAEMLLNEKAAYAARRVGKIAEAMDYAAAAFRNTQNRNDSSLRVLLSCIRGLPAADVIAFLNSQFDIGNPQRLEYLTSGTRMYGMRDIHAYYLDKKIKLGLGTKGDYIYLLLLFEKYGEVAKAAADIYGESDIGLAESLFLAAVCADDESIYRENESRLATYSRVLDAYFSGEPLAEVTQSDLNILLGNFGLIAMAAGIERANKLRRVFSAQPQPGFNCMVRYCSENGLYAYAFAEPMPDPSDHEIELLVIDCLIMAGQCDKAYERLESLFLRGILGFVALNYLLAIEARSAAVAPRARKLYDRYAAMYERFIDISDVAGTGYITDDFGKKKARMYQSLTPAQFRKQLAEDSQKPYIAGFAEVSEKAGGVYAEKGAYAAALECYRFAIAQGHNSDQNREKLGEMFATIGNYQMAGELKKK